MQMTNHEKNSKIEKYLENAKNNGLPKDAYLQVGYSCNAKCVMCNIWKQPYLASEQKIYSILDKLYDLGFEWVTLWGGEPLIHPAIDNIIQYTKNKGFLTQIITNGAMINKHIPTISKYVDNLVVSLDSGLAKVHDTIRNKEIFCDAVSGIKNILVQEKHPNIEIDCTILNENMDTLDSIIELSKELGGIFVDFDPAQILGVGNNKKYVLGQHTKGLDKAVDTAKKYNIEITSIEKIELIKKYLKKEEIIMPCYSYCKDMLISPYGEVHTCWTIDKIIGNVLDNNFKEKWHNALINNKEVLTGTKEECTHCGFSHSRMPDKEYSDIVTSANNIRLEIISDTTSNILPETT